MNSAVAMTRPPLDGATDATMPPADGVVTLAVGEDRKSVLFRSMRPSDEPYIFRTWLETYRDSLIARPTYQRRKWMDRRLYFKWQHAAVERLLRGAPGGRVVVACDPADPDTIYGWSVCGESPESPGALAAVPVLHYCYVKEPWRKIGIGRLLCATVTQAPLWYISHRTFAAEPVLERLRGWEWVPWAI